MWYLGCSLPSMEEYTRTAEQNVMETIKKDDFLSPLCVTVPLPPNSPQGVLFYLGLSGLAQ